MKLLINLQKSRKKIFINIPSNLTIITSQSFIIPTLKEWSQIIIKKNQSRTQVCLNTRSHIIQEEIIKRLWSIIASYLSHKKKKMNFQK